MSFTPGKLCDADDLPPSCAVCTAPSCRECAWLLDTINDILDLFFHCVNNALTDSDDVLLPVVKQTKAAAYSAEKRALLKKRTLVKLRYLETTSPWLIYQMYQDIALWGYNHIFTTWPVINIVGLISPTIRDLLLEHWPLFAPEMETYQDLSDAIVDLLFNTDPNDPNGLWYYVFWIAGIGCNVVEDIDEDRGFKGFGIIPALLVVLFVVSLIYYILTSILPQAAVFGIYIYWYRSFFKYWVALAFWMNPGCWSSIFAPSVILVPKLGTTWYVLFMGIPDVVFNFPLFPENFGPAILELVSPFGTPSLPFICPGCEGDIPQCWSDDRYAFTSPTRNLFFVLKDSFPNFYDYLHNTYYWMSGIDFDPFLFTDEGEFTPQARWCNIVSFPSLILLGLLLLFLLWVFILFLVFVLPYLQRLYSGTVFFVLTFASTSYSFFLDSSPKKKTSPSSSKPSRE